MNKQKTALQSIGWRVGLWLPALLLLSNPNLHTLDFLPDFIGYVLLLAGIRRLSLLDAGFAEVRRAFRRMLWLSIARMVGLIWVYTATAAYEQPTLILSVCFVLGVLELMTILPACRQLFGSLSYLATRLDGKAVFEDVHAHKIERLTAKLRRAEQIGSQDEARKKKYDRKLRRLSRRSTGDITDRMCRSCQMFAIAKTLFCVLPEFAALAYAPYDVGAIRFNWYAYIVGFRAIAFVIVAVFGIVWLCRAISYVGRISRDLPFWQRVAERCDEDARLHPERKPEGRLRYATFLLTVGFVFCINFRLDGINFLPGFVTPLAFLGAVICLASYLPGVVKMICGIVFSLQTVLSAYVWVQSNRFFGEFDLALYDINWNIRDAYARRVLDMAWPDALATVLSLVAVGAILFSLIERYTASGGAATHNYTSEDIARLRRKRIKCYLVFPAVLGVLMIAARLLNCYLLPWYEMMWLADLFASLAFAIFASLRVFAVKDELRPERMVSPDGES